MTIPRGRLLWLASYPKSGNTWTRALWTAYHGADDFSINGLATDGIASSRGDFATFAGLPADALLPEVVQDLKPEVYRRLSGLATRLMVVKVHDAAGLTSTGRPLFPADAAHGVVYLVRDPRDVATSWAHHTAAPVERAVAQLGDPDFVVSSGRRSPQLPQHLGSWSNHVRSWTGRTDLPVLVVRYEDLLADPHTTFASILRFADVDVEPDKLDRAVELTRFDNLRAQESESSFRERVHPDQSFFRRGVAGGWHDELAPALVGQIEHDHAEVMAEHGYVCESAAEPPTGSAREPLADPGPAIEPAAVPLARLTSPDAITLHVPSLGTCSVTAEQVTWEPVLDSDADDALLAMRYADGMAWQLRGVPVLVADALTGPAGTTIVLGASHAIRQRAVKALQEQGSRLLCQSVTPLVVDAAGTLTLVSGTGESATPDRVVRLGDDRRSALEVEPVTGGLAKFTQLQQAQLSPLDTAAAVPAPQVLRAFSALARLPMGAVHQAKDASAAQIAEAVASLR